MRQSATRRPVRWYDDPIYGGWHPYCHNGFIPAIISAVIEVVKLVVGVAETVGTFIWKTTQDAIQGLASASTWLWGHAKDFFTSIFKGLKTVVDTVAKGFKTLIDDYKAFKDKLDNFLKPLLKIYKTVNSIWKNYVQPIFNGVMKWIHRIRSILGLLKVLHVGWASKLDAWVAQFQAKVIQVDLQLLGYLREVGGFINLAFDPLGFLRGNVFVRSLFGALDQVAMAFTGKPWGAIVGFDLFGSWDGGHTAHLHDTMADGLAQIQSGTGDAGDIATTGPVMRQQVFSELGVTVPGL